MIISLSIFHFHMEVVVFLRRVKNDRYSSFISAFFFSVSITLLSNPQSTNRSESSLYSVVVSVSRVRHHFVSCLRF